MYYFVHPRRAAYEEGPSVLRFMRSPQIAARKLLKLLGRHGREALIINDAQRGAHLQSALNYVRVQSDVASSLSHSNFEVDY